MAYATRVLLAATMLACPILRANAAAPEFAGEYMPYASFDSLPHIPIPVGTATLQIGFAPGEFSLPQDQILDWIKASARAVSIYYGGFPVRSARVLVVPVAGRGVHRAQAFGYHGPAIRLMVGIGTTAADLKADWKAVHEMVHLALPEQNEQQLWLSEGLAVYVESIARVQAGDLTAERIWSDFVRDMPKGQPALDDGGLDVTHTWGRTYWGGAIFCLLADVEIRQRTGGRLGLQQAMRGVVKAHGNLSQQWPFMRILEIADAATGTDVMHSLYQRLRANPEPADLDGLWQKLGIRRDGDGVAFDDSAPLAAVRRAITAENQPAPLAPSSHL